MKIGIGITTHNRREVFDDTYKHIVEMLPKGAKLVVVDDASDEPTDKATFRFNENVGIATAKNKCLELLDDCEHIFLFDDDCYPKVKDWWKPYVYGDELHYCYIFEKLVNKDLGDCRVVYKDDKLVGFSHARGCMLYINHKILDVVGGMDTNYKKWGFEHVDWSNRIFNSQLTTFRYQDVPNSNELFFSGDEEMSVLTTVDSQLRKQYLDSMRSYFKKSFVSTKYCSYKPEKVKKIENKNYNNNVILTCYFTKQVDVERDITWEADEKVLEPLINSVGDKRLVILNDCFEDKVVKKNITFNKISTGINPYFQRWVSYYKYLREHKDIDNVWLIDATDVEMLKDPFNEMIIDKLYVGSEKQVLGCRWLIEHHKTRHFIQYFRLHRNNTLLNAGLVGGSREDVMEFCRQMVDCYTFNVATLDTGDMGVFNYVAYTCWANKLEYGPVVNTLFKGFETDNNIAWWKHK